MAKSKHLDLTGTVRKRPVGGASKSAREAVVLESDSGEFILQREGANPFYDPDLEALVGKRIRFRGVIDGFVFSVKSWEDAPSR